MPDQYETKHILIDHEIDVTVKVNIFYQEAPLTRYKLQSLRYHIIGVVTMWLTSTSKSGRGGNGDYDVTPYIFLILSLNFTSKSGRGRRRFARCTVEMGDCRRRVRGVL